MSAAREAAATPAKAAPTKATAALRVGPADDAFEREADRAADAVMRGGLAPWINALPGGEGVRRKCDACAKEDDEATLRRDAAGGDPGGWSAPAIVSDVLRSPGRPLEAGLRAEMERGFGHDFSRVRVHDDAMAAESARAVSAHAYTVGSDMVFGAGRYAPVSASGRRLVAHELAHVVQQSSGNPALQRQEVSVDLEVPTPAQREENRRLGIDLPRVSAVAADPRGHSDYIENRFNAVGFGIYLGGYAIYVSGLELPVLVPEAWFNFSLTNATPADLAIFPGRAEALAAVPIGPPAPGRGMPYTYFRGVGGLVAPTVFSPATTPRIIATALDARRRLAASVQRDLIILALSMVGARVLMRFLRWVGGRISAPRALPPPSGAALGRAMAQEMRAAGFRGNPFREFMRRINLRTQRLSQQETAEAIRVATAEFNPTMGTMPPVQQGGILVVPSRAPIPNAPVMGIRPDGTVMMGRVPRIDIVRDASGVPVFPPQARLEGTITWE
ncbi:MAG: DUF4157 domain-containing protein [Polyangiales bacterium]